MVGAIRNARQVPLRKFLDYIEVFYQPSAAAFFLDYLAPKTFEFSGKTVQVAQPSRSDSVLDRLVH